MKELSLEQRAKTQRHCFTEIIQGYSTLTWRDQCIFIKHLNHFDVQDTEEYYSTQYKRARDKGLPTEEERLIELKAQGFWTEEQEGKIKYLREYIDGLIKNRKKIIPIDQIRQNKEETDRTEKILYELVSQRNEFLRATCESFAARKQNDYYLRYSLYKDLNFKNLFFNDSDFEDLETNELNLLFFMSNQKLDLFSDVNIKWLAFASFFQNMFGLTESVYEFYGRPISQLTFYQINLAIYGVNYKAMLSSSENVPENVKQDPTEYEEWYAAKTNIKKLQEEKGEGVNVIGAKAEDYERYGLNSNGGININEMLKQGKIEKSDLFSVLK